MRFRGRPVLGGIVGLFFGLFVAVDLVMFKVLGTGSPVVLALPIIGLVLGIVGALWAPFGRERLARKAVVDSGARIDPVPTDSVPTVGSAPEA